MANDEWWAVADKWWHNRHDGLCQLIMNKISKRYYSLLICHSFHLCDSYASFKFSKAQEDLIKNICTNMSLKKSALLTNFQEYSDINPSRYYIRERQGATDQRLLEQYDAAYYNIAIPFALHLRNDKGQQITYCTY